MNTTPIAPDRDQWPTRSDLLDESDPFEEMTECEFGCGAHFHGVSLAYRRHMDYRDEFGVCERFWV